MVHVWLKWNLLKLLTMSRLNEKLYSCNSSVIFSYFYSSKSRECKAINLPLKLLESYSSKCNRIDAASSYSAGNFFFNVADPIRSLWTSATYRGSNEAKASANLLFRNRWRARLHSSSAVSKSSAGGLNGRTRNWNQQLQPNKQRLRICCTKFNAVCASVDFFPFELTYFRHSSIFMRFLIQWSGCSFTFSPI